ncbi:MAG: hypothetical protein SVM80_03665 [Halobacteriota archaeon]|nr:hypothetical protein [Halobacteriota archaeon]
MTVINIEWEEEVAEFFRSLGINRGIGDVQYRLILIVLSSNGVGKITNFSEIRKYTDQLVERGSIASKMKTVIQLEGLAKKVGRGEYVITEKGAIAADFIEKSSRYYRSVKGTMERVERIP